MLAERSLKWLVLVCIFIVPFIVLYVSNWAFFPYVFGKGLLFRLVTEVAFFGWVALVLFGALPKPRITWVHLSIGIFVSVVAIADMLGVAPFKSFWSNFERMDGLVTLVHVFMFFIVASSVLNTHKLWARFWSVSLVVSIVVGVQAIAELASGVNRIAGSTGNPIYLAVYALFHIFIAMLYAYRHKLKAVKALYMLVAALNFSVLWFTGTRGALLGLLVGLFVMLVIFVLKARGRDYRVWRIVAASLLIIFILSAGLFMVFKDAEVIQSNKMLKRMSHISLSTSDRHSTGALRLMVWETAIKGAREHPVLGWGQENFNYVFNKYYNPHMYEAEQWYDRTHNIFLDWLIAAGAVGLLAYLSMYVVLFIEALRAKYFNVVESSIVVGLLTAYLVHNLFVFDHIISYILFFSFAAWIHSVDDIELKVQETIKHTVDTSVARAIVGASVFLMMIVFMYIINYPAYMQNVKLISALQLSSKLSNTNEARELFIEASSYNTVGTQEVREHFLLTASKFGKLSHVSVKNKDRFLVSAVEEMQKQTKLYPLDARFPYFIASALTTHGQYVAAVPYLERALELSPTKVNFLTALGANAVQRDDVLIALSYYKRALSLENSNKKATKIIKLLDAELNK